MGNGCDKNPAITVDLSKKNFIGERKHIETWEMAVKITIVGLVDLVAILGNILVIIIVCHSNKMRTATNFYIMNLSIADLLVACFPIWILVVDDVTEGWVVGAYFCKFNPFIQITAMCASIFTLVAIASDRFFAIMFPLKARITQKRTGLVIGIIWACAVAIGMPALFFYKYTERQWKNFVERFCTDVWPQIRDSDGCDEGYRSKSTYWICVLVVLNWIPMVIMIVVYTIILIRLGRKKIIPSSGALSTSAIQQRSKRKVVLMLFAILIAFIVCAVPFQVTKLFELFRSDRSEALPDWFNPLYFVAVTLLYTNSALNPIIYSGLNENFKSNFRSIMKNLCKGKPTPPIISMQERRQTLAESVVESRRESKTSVLEGLADEHNGTFRFINNSKPSSSFMKTIP